MVFRKSFQSRSIAAPVGRFNPAFDENESSRVTNRENAEYRKRVRNHLISQLSFSDHELMDKWPGVGLRRLSVRKFSIIEEYEETNLVLVNVKNLEKRDFYADSSKY